jgi:uncharacterized protein
MWNANLVIDAVGHTYDFADDNRRDDVSVRTYDTFITWLYRLGHVPFEALEGGYPLTLAEFRGGWSTEELLQLFFVESDVDMVAMHAVNFFNLFERGANPWPQCLALKQAAPHRVLLYAPVDPLSERQLVLDTMAEHAAAGIDGFKFYPVNGMIGPDKVPLSYSFADEDILPIFDHARQLGIKHIAVHKAVPTAPGPHTQDRPDDVSHAAVVFPDMTFEVVHSGWAFLEDCAFQLQMNRNVYANLESTANTARRMPRRFLKAVGALLAAGPRQVLFGTGAPAGHPQPIIEAIDAITMPDDLRDEGLPELTAKLKADLMGANMARLHGLDPQQVLASCADDEFARRRREYRLDPQPWQLKRARVQGALHAAG